jgi:chemotaxis protein CheC
LTYDRKQDEFRLDVLKELGNIGAGHATTALSRLLGNKKLTLVVPQAMIVGMQESMGLCGGPESLVGAIYIRVSGGLCGHMALLLPFTSVQSLLGYLLGATPQEFSDMELSTLQEVGNIVVTSYLNALAEMTNTVLYPSVPAVAVDMAAAVWSSILAGAEVADYITIVQTGFQTDAEIIDGTIAFIPDEEDLAKLLEALGMGEL